MALRIAEDLPERALARDADEHGPAERAQLVEPPEELEVLVRRLAEADAGVDADALLADPAASTANADALLEEGQHIGDDVVVVRSGLHRPRLPLHVHETHVRASVRDHLGHLRVAAQRGDVVDELGAELERAPRDLRLRRVDRQRDPGEALEHRDDTGELLFRRDRRRARAASTRRRRRRAPRPRRRAACACSTRRRRLDEQPAVGEAVGRDVERRP